MRLRHKKLYLLAGTCLLLGSVGFAVLTSPWTWSATHPSREAIDLAGADLANGRKVFVASDCATCHMTPGQEDDTKLGGGGTLQTQFGVFHMPNISPDRETGLGGWTLAEFDRALREGVGPDQVWPDGKNLYPAFPYTSYQRLKGNDVRDLFAYLKTLEPIRNVVSDHELKFPYNIRRGVGAWRLLFLDGVRKEVPVPAGVDVARFKRGEYLVEGAGHCAECHSPRGIMGNVIADKRYSGGPAPDGVDYFPNITPDETGIGFWSPAAIANYLATGVNPIGRTAAGDMAEVIKNTSQLPREDLEAMALYLKHVPAVDKPAPGVPEPNRTDKVVMLKNAVRVAPSLPVSPETAIVQGADVWVAGTKSVWMSQDGAGSAAPEQGKLLGGAHAKVGQRVGAKVQLTVKGWQMADVPSIIYQAKGHRIMVAVLDKDAVAAVERGTVEKDTETGQSWLPVQVTFWSDEKNLNTDRQALWSYSATTFQKSCSACHVLPQKTHFTANQWIGTLKAMKRFTSFSDDQYRLILAYLQNHSKDLNEASGGTKH
ncbi:MAG: c-type cytochrome [Rhodopseudomonas sp.]|uniref:c-type cytochrome n=2 Tax=unclassified Rhodopseudomonas TaxID=2638247 RepID=UPI0039E42FEF